MLVNPGRRRAGLRSCIALVGSSLVVLCSCGASTTTAHATEPAPPGASWVSCPATERIAVPEAPRAPATPPIASASASASTEPRKLLVVKMIETGTEIRGDVAVSEVKRAVRSVFPRLRGCYERALKRNPAIAGLVATEFAIGADGLTRSASSHVAGTDLDDEEAVRFVEHVFGCLAFPSTVGEAWVRYPIEFVASKPAEPSVDGL
jgi:hypothetical protein